MNKLMVKGAVAIAIVLGIVYLLVPSNNTKVQNNNTTKSSQYVSLGSKGSTSSNYDNNVPQGFTVKVSQQALNSGILNDFETAIKDKYIGDGNVEIYIGQATGSFGGPEQVIYDVNINGKETMGLTASRNVTRQGFSTDIEMSPIVFGNTNNSEN
ncbi:hypothetical protein [uncultured Clostridium sp.]|jgi:hypothetical protein|uniref:hypothetical protein n=1 Tax=uncultured Clostridium sp. TaxID=59620 RepID=UPI0026067454|nr:hypothetical protein [uncultured Clostridium sp.]